MVDIGRKMYEKNGIEIKVDNDGLLWLNEKHIEEGLGHKNDNNHKKNHHKRSFRS